MRRKAAAPRLEHREVFQQRDDAQHDDHHAHDLLGAAVHRQHVDQIKDEDDDDKGDQCADENVHGILRVKFCARKTSRAPPIPATIVSTLDASSHDAAPDTKHPNAHAITPNNRSGSAIAGRRRFSPAAFRPILAPFEESTMPEPASLIMLQFLAWVADRPRTYAATMEAWHSTCPRLSVWEDAIIDGLVRIDNEAGRPVRLTPRGSAILEESRAHAT